MAGGDDNSGMTAISPDAADSFGGYVGDFFALMKPRVMSLVVFTALVGMVTAPGGIHPVLGTIAILAIAVDPDLVSALAISNPGGIAAALHSSGLPQETGKDQ